ncbi:LysR family transcriptional regulator [Mesorhizobium sp. KR9-304]|uniref:LysR family transcriptional regulator n=1 Tax=Mesorhizobium sp. KR9-304 TaxID=3156614 RepID=UPI0032B46187
MDLNPVAVFVKIAQTGSFSEAARQLSMPNSTVSAQLSRLERQLGVTLLQRTTRKLRLTEAGQAYFETASIGVEAILDAGAQVSAAQQEPRGTLRISAPIDMDEAVVKLLSDFRMRYPKVAQEVHFSQDVVDLFTSNIDVAIRAGSLKDSRLVARKVGTGTWVPVASPEYLRAQGRPAHPEELSRHSLIQFEQKGKAQWLLRRGTAVATVPLSKQIITNHPAAVRSFAIRGEGIALLPTYLCRSEFRDGTLVRILPEWTGETDPVNLVYPAQRFVAAKLRVFVDFAATALADVLAADVA